MHDWTLLSIAFDWRAGEVTLHLGSPTGQSDLCAVDVRDLRIPRARPWRPSASVNNVEGLNPLGDGLLRLAIEIPSGDVIEIIAQMTYGQNSGERSSMPMLMPEM